MALLKRRPKIEPLAMHALVTGASGTVGRALVRSIEGAGGRVTKWDRAVVPIDRYEPMERFVRETAPDAIFHLAIASRPTGREGEGWLVNYEWTSELAWIARTLEIPFVFTSTAMVFSHRAKGPFSIDTPPDAFEGYGLEKRRAEERVFQQCPAARVVRLGWQIADELDSNNMWDHLVQRGRKGPVAASTEWIPACSFVDLTAAALAGFIDREPGLYHLDQNEGVSFFELARALAHRAGDPFEVVPSTDFAQDQRLLDPRLRLPPLRDRLPSLRAG
jgi:dTDP-4-dehydrorhamnose reductase